MHALRRAVARKDVLLALVVFVLSGGWFTWHLLAHRALGDIFAGNANTAISPSVAQAADLRGQIDAGASVSDLAGQIRQVLAPVVARAEPQAPDASSAWRQGLALLVDANILAAGAGDSGAEGQALSLMRNYCPQDAWSCYFQIPPKALAAAQAGQLDDHARIAMYTATAFLYVQAGDRIHGDALQRKAIKLYEDMLENYDGWDGQQAQTLTPRRSSKPWGVSTTPTGTACSGWPSIAPIFGGCASWRAKSPPRRPCPPAITRCSSPWCACEPTRTPIRSRSCGSTGFVRTI